MLTVDHRGATARTASFLLKASVPIKVVSERLSHATASFTLDVQGRVLPGLQADGAAVFSRLMSADPPSTSEELGHEDAG